MTVLAIVTDGWRDLALQVFPDDDPEHDWLGAHLDLGRELVRLGIAHSFAIIPTGVKVDPTAVKVDLSDEAIAARRVVWHALGMQSREWPCEEWCPFPHTGGLPKKPITPKFTPHHTTPPHHERPHP